MKTIIAGSREISSYATLLQAIHDSGFEITEVVSGAARGVDRLGEKYANEFGIALKQFPADWDGLGKGAGYARNRQMAEYAEAAIILWDGRSKGTKHMIDLAEKHSLKIHLVKSTEF